MTLARVIEELLAQGKRILLVSTTNAAIDRALASKIDSRRPKSYADDTNANITDR